LRLLLAVLYRALEGPMNDADWSALWRAEELPKKPIDAYPERWRSRFDLLDSKASFFQVADLEATSGEGGERATSATKWIEWARTPPGRTLTTGVSASQHGTRRGTRTSRASTSRRANVLGVRTANYTCSGPSPWD
jgi:CRISPR type I-E-associated protein CasA/Cse1